VSNEEHPEDNSEDILKVEITNHPEPKEENNDDIQYSKDYNTDEEYESYKKEAEK